MFALPLWKLPGNFLNIQIAPAFKERISGKDVTKFDTTQHGIHWCCIYDFFTSGYMEVTVSS